MHVQRCYNVVFANNQILGTRMGACSFAEYCKNATISGNLVDGSNGSRVMSVEKSCEDVTIIGNTFRNGGRGSWINQPKNFILQGNVFVNNTTKGEHDPRRGRRDFTTGDYERWPELYFTLYQANGRYGPVIVRDNIFVLADSCATNAGNLRAQRPRHSNDRQHLSGPPRRHSRGDQLHERDHSRQPRGEEAMTRLFAVFSALSAWHGDRAQIAYVIIDFDQELRIASPEPSEPVLASPEPVLAPPVDGRPDADFRKRADETIRVRDSRSSARGHRLKTL